MTNVDTESFKAQTREHWNRDAQGWNQYHQEIDGWLRESTDAMLSMAGIGEGARVLDVAAGAGNQTLDIAARIGGAGYVLATDISPAIIALAAENARQAGFSNVGVQAIDGEILDMPPEFDAVVCRLGLMFFPEPERGLRGMLNALKPGGRCCTMVFSSPDRNPCVRTVLATALKHAGKPRSDPYAPGGLLSLGKPGLMDELFRGAGFTQVATTKVSAPFSLPSARHYIEFIRTSASPILAILSGIGEEARKTAWDEMESQLAAYNTSDGWEGPNELLLTLGCRK